MQFIINTLTRWDEPPRARHQVAYSLSEIYPVVFVSSNKVGLPQLKVIQVNTNLNVLIPYFPIDFRIRYRVPVLNEIYQYWLFRLLKRKYPDYRVINFDFTATRIYNFYRDVIFYCNDDFWGISKKLNSFPISSYLLKCIERVSERARFNVGISEVIVEKLKLFNPNSYLIKLGGPDISKIKIKPKLKPGDNINKINCGLVGFVTSHNTSVSILNNLLTLPNIFLTIIGPVDKTLLSKLENTERISLKGVLTGDLLYQEINDFDVAIAPYNVRQMNEGGTPNKLWQYMAMGKPVVLRELVATKNWTFKENMVYVAKSDKDFNFLVKKSFEDNTSELIAERIVFASNNSWDKRIQDLLNIYDAGDISQTNTRPV